MFALLSSLLAFSGVNDNSSDKCYLPPALYISMQTEDGEINGPRIPQSYVMRVFKEEGKFFKLKLHTMDCCCYDLIIHKDGSPYVADWFEYAGEYTFTEEGHYMILADAGWASSGMQLIIHTNEEEPVSLILNEYNTFSWSTLSSSYFHVRLEGALIDGSHIMHQSLKGLNDFPFTEPYTAMGMLAEVGGNESLPGNWSPAYLASRNVVDWVRIEFLPENDTSRIAYARHFLIGSHGNIQWQGGVTTILPGRYHVRVRHRNHLSHTTGAIGFYGFPFGLDLTSNALGSLGPDTRVPVPNGSYALKAGNSLWDAGKQVIKYIGQGNDRDPILERLEGNVLGVIEGYFNEDVNLDGVVKYAGQMNDRDVILQSIGGTIPTAVVTE